jgi:hypothetical protein
VGEACCIGNNAGGYWCSVGLACQPGTTGKCVSCGAKGQICCAGALCKTGTCNGQNQCM